MNAKLKRLTLSYKTDAILSSPFSRKSCRRSPTISRQKREDAEASDDLDKRSLAFILDPDKADSQLSLIFVEKMKSFFARENFSEVFPNLFNLLWHSAATTCHPTQAINSKPLLQVKENFEECLTLVCRNASGRARRGNALICSGQFPLIWEFAVPSTWQTPSTTTPTQG